MLVPTFGSVAQASAINIGIGNVESVENTSGSTADNRLNLGGGSHKVDISIKQRSVSAQFAGKPRLTGVVRVPAELQGLVKPAGEVTLTGAISLDGQDQAWMTGINKTLTDIINRINVLGEEVAKKGFNIDANITEIVDTLDFGNSVINLGKGTFDMGPAKVSQDGSYIYIDSNKGAGDYIAKSINDLLDNAVAALNAIEIKSTHLGDWPNASVDAANTILNETRTELIPFIDNAKDAITGMGGMATSGGSFSLAGTTEFTFPVEIQDPLFHAKDANGNNLFLPNNVDELSYEEIQNLTAKQKQYDAKFVGVFDNANLVDIFLDLDQYISEHAADLIGTKNYTTIYYGYNGSAAHRIAGPDRYATAAQVSAKSFKTADSVVLVNGQNYVDVAPATVLAAKQKAPVLLTQANVLPEATRAEIERLGAKNVIVVGGEGSVSNSILANYSVDRITGSDRYDTAANVAARINSKTNKAVVVNSDAWADALVMTSVAIKEDAPILFTDANTLPEASIKAISSLDAKYVYVAGGENTISKGVLNALEVDKVERIAGNDRFETAVAAGKTAYPEAKYAVATNGMDFIDALVAAPYASLKEAPIVLVTPAAVHPATVNYVSGLNRITVVGGPNSVSDAVLAQLTELVSK